jgi:hypothetical protein
MKKLALILSLILSLHSVVRRDDIPDELYIEFGQEPEFMCVGLVKGDKSRGTGTLIDPYTVLTAAHVVSGNEEIAFLIFNPESQSIVTIEGTAQIHENFVMVETESGGITEIHNDIALIHLATPIYFVTPAKLNYKIIIPPFNFISAGFGGTRTDSLTPFFYDLKKRGYESTVYLFNPYNNSDEFYITGFSTDHPDELHRLGGFSVFGDSGSGAFYAYNRTHYLFGILSMYVHANMNPGNYDLNYFLPIAPYEDWIESNRSVLCH